MWTCFQILTINGPQIMYVDYLDNKLPRLLRMVNESPASLKSPVISDMPVNHDSGENHNEGKINQIYCC